MRPSSLLRVGARLVTSGSIQEWKCVHCAFPRALCCFSFSICLDINLQQTQTHCCEDNPYKLLDFIEPSADHSGHELSSLAWTLGSWVRIPLKAWMFAFILIVLPCVGSGIATGWSSVQGVLQTVLRRRNCSETKRFSDTLCSEVGATAKSERETEAGIIFPCIPLNVRLCPTVSSWCKQRGTVQFC
jgi:hypothetical protein